jgi:hypothetical protein
MRSSLLVAAVVLAVAVGATPAAAAVSRGECASPSINRYQQWLASGEGATVPAAGSLLVPVRGHARYAARISFVGTEWHVAVLWLANQFEAQADLSRSAGFLLTYSATGDLHVQLRPASHWSGGAQWATRVTVHPGADGDPVLQPPATGLDFRAGTRGAGALVRVRPR